MVAALSRRQVMVGLGLFGVASTLPIRTASAQVDPGPPTADTLAVNQLLARGGEVRLEPRIYDLTADSAGRCLVMGTANTHLIMAPGTVLRLAPTAVGNYQVLYIKAPDCRVTGGQIIGDVRSHLGTEGEWGFGVRVAGTAHRTRLENVSVTECWGDGYYVGGGPEDVALVDCTAQSNRRQGLTVSAAVRPQVIRGRYSGTGMPLGTNPGAGIDLEPNAGEAIVNALLRGVELFGNKGPGLVVSGSRGTTTAEVIGCVSSSNGGAGYLVAGAGAHVVIRSAAVRGNQVGIVVDRRVDGCTIRHLRAEHNREAGFMISGQNVDLRSSAARGNGAQGFLLDQSARACHVADLTVAGNGKSRPLLAQVEVAAPAGTVRGVRVVPPLSTGGTPPVVIKASATGTVVSDVTATRRVVGVLVRDERPPVPAT